MMADTQLARRISPGKIAVLMMMMVIMVACMLMPDHCKWSFCAAAAVISSVLLCILQKKTCLLMGLMFSGARCR